MMAIITMICEACNGRLEVDENRRVIFCPYCGAKKMIIESDDVKKEQIKYDAYRDVSLGSLEIERQTKLDAINAQERKEKRDNRNSAIIFALMALASILCFIFAFK